MNFLKKKVNIGIEDPSENSYDTLKIDRANVLSSSYGNF